MQIPLPFPQRRRGDGDDCPYLEGEANRVALGFLKAWRANISEDPATLGVIITGGAGAGKSRLAREIGREIDALVYSGEEVAALLHAPLTGTGYVIDNCERCAPTDLMGFINHCFAQAIPFILTGSGVPAKWAGEPALPDLQTRLSALPQTPLDLPDADLLSQALGGFLATYEVTASETARKMAIDHIRRDFRTASQLAEYINEYLLVLPGAITRDMIQDIVTRYPELKG